MHTETIGSTACTTTLGQSPLCAYAYAGTYSSVSAYPYAGVYAYVATPPRTKGRACDGTRKVFLGEFFRSNIDIVGPGTGTPLSA
eukprot:3876158-Rhodomonas_salina.1